MMLTPSDEARLREKGLTAEAVERQIDNFVRGFPYLDIVRAATPGDGILKLTGTERRRLAETFDRRRREHTFVKFVPASGAATRMFKDLFTYLDSGLTSAATDETVSEISRFAFYPDLCSQEVDTGDYRTVIRSIVEAPLHYGRKPKALIKFHRYPDGTSRTALEEHLAEGALYAANADGTVDIHFTVSPEHLAGFHERIQAVLPRYETRYGVRYRIGYSRQNPATDTLAVNPDNTPFRNPDGSLLFRPAGHGALLENLNALDADLIFIKNIDNVCPESRITDTVTYKKVLAGLLLEVREKIFSYTEKLRTAKEGDPVQAEAAAFIEQELAYRLPGPANRETLLSVLDRPIRVCGMVRNEGEPGGGPFWARNPDGSLSLQIAETAQIAPERKSLLQSSTHFNPVDLVCSIRNGKGEKYDLSRYRDPQAGLISAKSKDGKELKAQELPGLWNGSMADWTTLFVEVPVTTFTPVKTVNDLLRPQHQ